MKVFTTIGENYCPSWGHWEGIRELVQNWMDERGPDDTIGYADGDLVLVNYGGRLGADALTLLGETTKAGDADTRGQFGEGLKIGLLALLRAGCEVVIRTGPLTWRPKIRPNVTGAKVLAFFSREHPAGEFDGVRIAVRGFPRETWEEYQDRFLFDAEPNTILKDRPGKLYVKGIWVQDTKLRYGYNLKNVELDRDRRMAKQWDVQWEAASAINRGMSEEKLTIEELLELCIANAQETRSFEHVLDAEWKRQLIEAFQAKYGRQSVPCEDQHEVDEFDRLGVHGIITSSLLVKLLIGYRAEIRRSRRILRILPADDLQIGDVRTIEWLRKLFDVNIAVGELARGLAAPHDDGVVVSEEFFACTDDCMVAEVAEAMADDETSLHDVYTDALRRAGALERPPLR